ncbi:hypothetical protein [Bacteroides sp.]|uniref:hypothetical protein n=1 Tax=Bacteroides sp. TaxID=29523 RepID=UPI00263476CD|nr:hypothetical protein [Bacteroides sp.]
MRESRESNREMSARLLSLDARVSKVNETVSNMSAQLDANNRKTDALECDVETVKQFIAADKGSKQAYTFIISIVSAITAVTALLISL